MFSLERGLSAAQAPGDKNIDKIRRADVERNRPSVAKWLGLPETASQEDVEKRAMEIARALGIEQSVVSSWGAISTGEIKGKLRELGLLKPDEKSRGNFSVAEIQDAMRRRDEAIKKGLENPQGF